MSLLPYPIPRTQICRYQAPRVLPDIATGMGLRAAHIVEPGDRCGGRHAGTAMSPIGRLCDRYGGSSRPSCDTPSGSSAMGTEPVDRNYRKLGVANPLADRSAGCPSLCRNASQLASLALQ